MPAKFIVEITPSAEADVAEIWDYIAQENPANAEAFVLALEEQIASLDPRLAAGMRPEARQGGRRRDAACCVGRAWKAAGKAELRTPPTSG